MNKTPWMAGLIIAALALVVIVFAVTRDNNSPAIDTSQQTPAANATNQQTTDSSQPAAPQTNNEVQIEDNAFAPRNIQVKAGTTVTWTNKDSVPHTVTADDKSQVAFDSGNLGKNQIFSFKFDQTGVYAYHCELHPNMTGTVTVTK